MRFWHEFVAAVGDLIAGGVPALGMGLLILTGLVAVLWYWFPEWVHGLVRAVRRLVRGLSSLRWRRRQRHAGSPDEEADPLEPEPTPDDQVPQVAAVVLTDSADELAAQGRFKEAVRERLRAIVRDLIEREVIEHHPGWTVTELATTAGLARPATAVPLGAASEVFSGIWYGQRDATAADDAAMRAYADQVRAALDGVQVSV